MKRVASVERSMTSLLLAICLRVFAVAQGPAQVESLRAMAAQQNSDGILKLTARQQPDSVRTAISRTFALAASAASTAARGKELLIARRLAAGYARAWSDPFFLREVARFEAWSPAQRAARVAADSLRRAGNVARGQAGVPAAMRLWREALRRSVQASDSAGIAAGWVNVGAGFYLQSHFDSAAVYLARARDLGTRIGDFRTTGNAVGMLANVAKDQSEFANAAELYAQAAALRARSGDSRGMAADQNNIGTIEQELGDFAEARRAFEQALALHRRDGRSREVALVLTNLADIASTTGDFARAHALYTEALNTNRSSGDVAQAAFVLRDLGQLAVRRGDYSGARMQLSAALRRFEQTGEQLEAIAARQDLAAVEAAMGDLQSALLTLRRAERDAQAASADPTVRGNVSLAKADLAVQLGNLADASAEYERAEQLFRAGGAAQSRAAAQQGRGLLLYLREDYAGALRVLELAQRTQITGGDRRSIAQTQLLVGHVQRESGDTAAARRTLVQAHEALRASGDVIGEAATLHALGQVAFERGATLAAESFYRRGLERLGTLPATDVSWRLHASLGEALLQRKAHGPAADQLRAAIAGIERMAATIRVEDRRAGFLSDKWHVYAQLARLEVERGRFADAFAVSERMRARQLLEMLERGRIATARAANAREQDLRRRITELTSALESAADSKGDLREPALAGTSIDDVREALDQTQREYADLLVNLRETDPAYARLVTSGTRSWSDLAARLRRDELFLEYLVLDSSAIVFAVTRDTVVAIDLDVERRTLANLVDFSRRTIMLNGPDRTVSSPQWRTSLRSLQRHLIEPVERAGLLQGKRSLIIAPHAELHFLPFAALLAPGVRDRFLIEQFQLAYAPSATVWLRLGERIPTRRNTGVLALAPRVDRLPASRDEVAAVRAIRGRRATVRVGGAATESALRAGIRRNGILHLATFGVLNKHNPLFSFIELAPENGADGRLEVHEVFGLELTGQLVVLSACQTALGSGAAADVPPGDDWVGLVQAFLHAGAGSVLATLWPVNDRATAQLMEHFHRRLAAGSADAAALADAQRAALRDPRTAHPFYWAGFTLGGTRAPN